MPDRRGHRGKHPEDDRLFAPEQLSRLRAAVAEYSWLLGHDYALPSALKLVGDRHALAARQRAAVMRCSATELACARRRASCIELRRVAGGRVAVDGYNVLITLECALSGGVVLVGRDGCPRDLAGLHGTYRRVEETLPALRMIMAHLDAAVPAEVTWLLDRPVSNSGRLCTLLRGLLAARREPAVPWAVELHDSPDAVLADYAGAIATSDSAVLDRSPRWINLAAEIMEAQIPGAWLVDLRAPA